KDLLFRLVANRAGVIKHQPRLFDRRNLTIPLLQKRPNHLLGVVRIHLAPKGFEVKRLGGGVRHGVSINQQGARQSAPMSSTTPSHPNFRNLVSSVPPCYNLDLRWRNNLVVTSLDGC